MRRLLSLTMLALCAAPAWAEDAAAPLAFSAAPASAATAPSATPSSAPRPTAGQRAESRATEGQMSGSPALPDQASAKASTPDAVAASGTSTGSPPSPGGRTKWEERFGRANLAHDGHLTLEEANGGYRSVAKHFHEIDADGKGYVTENDIRAWHALQKASRAKASRTDDPLRPRNAMQSTISPAAHPLNTGTTQTVAGFSSGAGAGTGDTTIH